MNLNKTIKKIKKLKIKENKGTFAVYVLLRLAVIFVLVMNVLNRNYENVFVCVLTLILFLVPFIIEDNFKIEIPPFLEIVILLFIFAAEILGEINAFYIHFPKWDDYLHTINGFIMAAIGFSLIEILNTNKDIKIKLTPLFTVIVAFCFSMTIGVLWEFFEFGCDRILKTDCQKDTYIKTISTTLLDDTNSNKAVVENIDSVVINGEKWDGYIDVGLYDTMHDLYVNMIGAIGFLIVGYFYIKYRKIDDFEKLIIVKKNKEV